MPELTVVIQAGGESRRMGQSKATVPFLGEPLIWRTIRRLGSIADELIITTNEPERLGFLSDLVASGSLTLKPDIVEVRGALNGLYTALAVSSKPFVAVVACDMIFASAPLLTAELEALVREDTDVAVPALTHGYEPFHAVYRRETCLPLIEAALKRGESRANGWYDQARLTAFDSEMVLAADPRGGSFVNVNTPDELHRMEERILNEEMTFLASNL